MGIKLEVKNISKSFQSRLEVLKNILFSVGDGEFLCILGPSGCGKTTLLRILDGLIKPDEGHVLIDGAVITEPDYDRAFIFQDINLLPWRTVLDNVILGLEFKGIDKEIATHKAVTLLELVGLQEFMNYYPKSLSGGMKQRVGIARALAVDPDILLADEPFGFLDALTRENLQLELQRIIGKTKKTVIFVTHDIDEAIFLGDRVIVMSPRPAEIKMELEIKIDRPRLLPQTKLSTQFSEIKKILWEALTIQQENEAS